MSLMGSRLRRRSVSRATTLSFVLAGILPLQAGADQAEQAGADQAEQAGADQAEQAPEVVTLDEIVVTGTHIKGARIDDILPVTVIDEDDLKAIAPTSADEIFRAIPQAGDVTFNEQTTDNSNAIRGDIASINLRGIGAGNTLVLLNGRRLVLHPGTNTLAGNVPVNNVNANALPAMGIQRVEVLRDGASAIYGADAVAGVVNTILDSNPEGVRLNARYGIADGTNHDDLSLTVHGGFRFNGERSSLSLFASDYSRDYMLATEQPFSASSNLLPLVEGTSFEGNQSFDNRSSNSPWGQFDAPQLVSLNDGTSLTTASGRFHVQPTSSPGCLAAVAATPNLCVDDSNLDTDLRYDNNRHRSLIPKLERGNFFAFFNHELGGGLELFSELSYYQAESTSVREPIDVASGVPITVPANNYWNPFGPVAFSNGAPNPNRIPNLDIPEAGLPLVTGGTERYKVVDAGDPISVVDSDSFRALFGSRGELGDWSWETAGLYSEATTTDTEDGISSTLFQQALANETPLAYNPFNGGDPDNRTFGDTTLNDAATINSFKVTATREFETTLALVDVKFSTPAIFSVPAGGIGAAVGTEWRRESYFDDLDPRLDGSVTFTDVVTGEFFDTDLMGTSATPDNGGSRNVFSAFVEFAVPLVADTQDVPLIHSLDLQLAARYERYSDFGNVLKPKVAMSWYLAPWLQVRAAYSEGFRAPNLQVIHSVGSSRVNTRTDLIRCEALFRRGVNTSPTFSDCGESFPVVNDVRGNRDVEAEDSTNYSFGIVFSPEVADGLTITLDYWNIEQDGVIDRFGDSNHIALDFVRLLQGSGNFDVVRAPVSDDDIALFAGSGLEPVGEIIAVRDTYLNLFPRRAEGIDLGFYYDLRDTPLGDFGFGFNAARLTKLFQELTTLGAEINTAIEQGVVREGTVSSVGGEGDLVKRDGNPEWRLATTLTWSLGPWQAGLQANYVSEAIDNSVSQTAEGEDFVIEDWVTANIYGEYTFSGGLLDLTSVRLGAINVFDEDPPLADNTFGYDTKLHSPRGRFIYASLTKRF